MVDHGRTRPRKRRIGSSPVSRKGRRQHHATTPNEKASNEAARMRPSPKPTHVRPPAKHRKSPHSSAPCYRTTRELYQHTPSESGRAGAIISVQRPPNGRVVRGCIKQIPRLVGRIDLVHMRTTRSGCAGFPSVSLLVAIRGDRRRASRRSHGSGFLLPPGLLPI